jgi:hypothetical protein
MSTFSRLKSTAKQATDSTFGSLGIAIPLVMIPAAIYGYADVEIMGDLNREAQKATGLGGAMNIEQSLMIEAMLTLTGLDLVLELIFGPIIAAGAIYTVSSRRNGRNPTLYGAINFALSRYRRLFLWHAAAQLSIKLGMLALIPGVLFMMMYAMVDPVLCFEQEKWPLDRSKRLTRAWRKTLFLFMLPWVIVVAIIPLVLFWSSSQGVGITLAISVLYYLSLFWLQAGFCWLYLERLDAGRQAAHAKSLTEAEGGALHPEASSPLPDPAAAAAAQVSSPSPSVQPMGMGQKIGLTLIALAMVGMAYSMLTSEDAPSITPEEAAPTSLIPAPTDPTPDAAEGGAELPPQ